MSHLFCFDYCSHPLKLLNAKEFDFYDTKLVKYSVRNEDIPNPIEDEGPYEYAKTKLYMYYVEVHKVVLKCGNCILDPMIVIIGKDASIEKN